MKKAFLTLCLLGTISSCGKISQTQSVLGMKAANFVTDSSGRCQNINCQKLRKEFDFIVYMGKELYCYWDLKKETTHNDYDQIAKDLKASITDDTSLYEYYLILRKWAGSFQDGHVNAMWGSDLQELEAYVVPLTLELLAPGTNQETLIIAKNTPSTKKFPVGAIVTKINGISAMERLNSIEKYMSGSTSRMRRMQAARLLFSIMNSRKEEKSAVKLEFLVDDKTLTEEAPRNITLPIHEDQNKPEKDEPIDFTKIVQVQILPNNIGYLRIDGFSGGDEMSALLERSLKLLADTSGLIIDVRDNGGGDQSGNAIIAHLIESQVVRYHHRIRINDLLLQDREETFLDLEFDEHDLFTPYAARSVTPKAPLYKGKVYVLTSPKCFSACDTFTSAMKENHLATIVGEGTGGGTGTPYSFSLNYSGLSFRYSVAQGLTAVKKEYLEGVGTLPDIEIFPTKEERMKGEDQQLVKAINSLAQDIGRSNLTSSDLQNIKMSPPQKDSFTYTLMNENLEIKKWQKAERPFK